MNIPQKVLGYFANMLNSVESLQKFKFREIKSLFILRNFLHIFPHAYEPFSAKSSFYTRKCFHI